MALSRQIRTTARAMFRLSLENGQVTETRVREVLAWFEHRRPWNSAGILREYRRLIAREIARGRAHIEHAGALPGGAVASIIAELSKIYSRPITADTRENPALLAGVRVSIGDDVYERSIAAQLEILSAAT